MRGNKHHYYYYSPRTNLTISPVQLNVIHHLNVTFSTFSPSTPCNHNTSSVTPVEDPEITIEEIRRKVFTTKPWKAPGRDGIPAAVWHQLWPVISKEILDLFKASLNEGYLPTQWREAKIIPLKKPGKSNYRLAKAWRPISLLATLSKIFEAVLAERISYAAEIYNLLPQNHFGAR